MRAGDLALSGVAALLLAAGGAAGGMSRWAGAADQLPFIIWALALPCLAVWISRRASNPIAAIGVPTALGLVFVGASLPFYPSEESLAALIISGIIPAIVAGVAYIVPGKSVDAARTPDARRALAQRITTWGLIGIVVFPQLLQPATLAAARQLAMQGKARGEPVPPVGAAQWVAIVILSLIGLVSVISILAALADAA